MLEASLALLSSLSYSAKNAAHCSMSARRRSNRSVRRYAASMAFVFTWANANSHTSRGASEHSAAQSRKLDRKPCGTAPIPRSRTSFAIASLESSPPRAEGNTGPEPSDSSLASRSTARAPVDSGTRCSRPVFIRSGGMRHSRASRSHLLPPRAPHLAAPARRQHQELERQHGRGIRTGATHLLQNSGDLRIGERREMLRAESVLGERRADGLADLREILAKFTRD